MASQKVVTLAPRRSSSTPASRRSATPAPTSKSSSKNTSKPTRYSLLTQIGLNKDSIDFDKIKKAHLFVLAAPKDLFAPSEVEDLKKYVDNGGNLLVLSHEGGDRK